MQLHITKNIEELSSSAAVWITDYINKTLQKKERFTIALSGGSTPEKLHHLLAAAPLKDKIDWSKLHFFWGDERFVPFDDKRNNAKMAFDTLLDLVPVNKKQIHIMQTENIEPEASAKAYEKILHQYFDGEETSFDLVLLGMGDDGHTLSLFPGQTEVIHEEKNWCAYLWLQQQDMYRITLTHGIVNKAACILFLVSGSKKANALQHILEGAYKPDVYPSQIIKPESGELHWFTDEDAAALLKHKQ